jgi:hypothetical protein
VPFEAPTSEAEPEPQQEDRQERPAPRLRLRTEAEMLALPPVEWWVRGWLPRQSILLWSSDPKCGKTTAAIALAKCLAAGHPWFGLSVTEPCSVLFAGGEGDRSVAARLRGFLQANPECRDAEGRAVTFANLPPLTTLEGQAAFEAELATGRHQVLVIDTLAHGLAGLVDENDNSEVQGVLTMLCGWRDRFGITIILLHHRVKDETRKGANASRGGGAIRAAVDGVVSLARTQDAVTLTVDELRDGAAPAPLRLRMIGSDVGPWFVPAGAAEQRTEEDPAVAAQATIRERAAKVPAALAGLLRNQPRVTNRDWIAKAMGGRLSDARMAVAIAVDSGWIVNIGTDKRPDWREGRDPPYPPGTRDAGVRVRERPGTLRDAQDADHRLNGWHPSLETEA